MERTVGALLGPSLLGIAGCALATAGPPQVEVAQVELRGIGVAGPACRSGRLDLLSAGSDLLADAAAPSGTRCSVSLARA